MVSVQARRSAVSFAGGKGLSQRRACTLLKVGRSALHYRSRLLQKDAKALARMAELSAQYPRYGYRRIAIFLRRDGFSMSFSRAHRLWRKAQLQVPRKRTRKRVATSRPRPKAPTGVNQVWSYDFVFDTCANGQQLKCLTVTDEWTKEGLAIEVDGSIRSGRVIEVLSRLVSERGAPKYMRSDNGPEFVSLALLKWIADQGIETALIEPGKPWQNGSTESFNGKFRDECLSLEWFRSRAEAKVVIESWRKHYNDVRPHSSLGYLTPAAFAARIGVRADTKIRTDAASANATCPSAAALRASALGHVAQPSCKGHSKAAMEAAVSS
jgi:putative transposase